VTLKSLKSLKSQLALVAVAAIGLAACGSSSSTTATKPKATTPQATGSPTTGSPTTSGAAAVVDTAANAKLGQLLVDAKGLTLYTLTNAGTPVACTGQCLTFWPPLLLPSGTTTASGGAGVTGLGTVAGAGGTQVTEKGAPLYRFSGDTAAGSANGEGISSFGGVWHVVKASGTSGASAPDTTVAPSTTTMGGYGY
jgi:predicted lipoprotein with Yx(FWY)xxD motif